MAKSHKIRQVIKTTKKTAVITKAMQVVSASKLPNALCRLEQAAPYADLAYNIMSHYTELGSHPYFKARNKSKATGLLVISSDRGLCGSLNLQLFKQVISHVLQEESNGKSVHMSVLGQKGIQFFQKSTSLVSQADSLGDKPTLEQLMPLIQPLLSLYDKGKVDGIYVAYNAFENTLSQVPTIKPLLPLPLPESAAAYPPDYQHEPNVDTVVNTLLTQYIESTLYRLVIENITSEQAARMIAMKNATDSANDIIESLNLTYNKIRQALITQEIAEISAGANQSTGEDL
ncbi:MAG: ATP synthase F1 subunit gamma [Pseudomonadota bacterium]|nr:ATP synthase F1 subunit gamma [Pseudomonadota bacterium]